MRYSPLQSQQNISQREAPGYTVPFSTLLKLSKRSFIMAFIRNF